MKVRGYYYGKYEKTDTRDMIYVCDESAILGTVCTDGETFIIELEEERENDVFGFQPSCPNIKEKGKENSSRSKDFEICME